MKATFVFADDSKLSVNAFNSVKAKLAHLPNPPIKVFFDINTTDWVSGEMEGFAHFQQRDADARTKWLNECYDIVYKNLPDEIQPDSKSQLTPSTLTPEQQTAFLLPKIKGKTIECNSNIEMKELHDCYNGPAKVIPPIGKPGKYPKTLIQ